MNINYMEFDNFASADEFIDCFSKGCEMEFDYDGRSYGVVHTQDGLIAAYEAYNEESEICYDTPQAVLEHPIGNKRLKDILQDMEVIFRAF